MKKYLWLLLLLPTSVLAQNQARMISGTNNITVCPYTITKQDVTKLDVFITSSACAVSLPAATTGGYGKGSIFSVKNNGTGSVTITIGGGESIDGNPSVTLLPGAGMDIYSTGTGYSSQPGAGGGGGGGGGINPPAGDIGGNAVVPLVISTHLNSPLPILQGGTGTQTPALVAGTGVTITGTWPNNTISSTSACWENNGSPLTCEPFANAVPPLVATLNVGNSSIDITCPAAVGVGGSHASGCVPDPGASGTTTDYLGRDMAYHTSGSASTVKPDPASGIMYVAQICNGGSACSDSNDGLSWGSAKLTPYAALQALPNGATSPPTAGNGIVYVANDVNGIAYGGPVAGGHGGWWMFDSTDPNFAGGATGFMRVPTVGSVTMECAAPTGSVIHQGGAVCMEYWGGSTNNTQPAFWFATGSGKQVLRGFSFSNQATGGKIGIDSNNNRSGNTGTSSVWLDRVQVNLGNCFDGVGAGPALDIGGASFWINITHGSYSGCTTQDYTATASRTSNVVTLTLNTSATGDISAGNNAYIIVRNMTDPTFNGAFPIASASGTSVTFAQNGPNASTSGGQVFPYSASAIGINSGTGPGAGFVYVDDTAVNGGAIWAQGGFNGVGLSANKIVYEGNGLPDMSVVEILPTVSGGDSTVYINDVQYADNINPICGVESLGAGNASAQNTTICGQIISANNEVSSLTNASPLRQGTFGLYANHIAASIDTGRRMFSPYAVRFANLLTNNNTLWNFNTMTPTAAQSAPDGTTGATLVTNSTGSTQTLYFGGTSSHTPAIGDIYVFGVWIRGVTTAPVNKPKFVLNFGGGGAGTFCQGRYLSGSGVSQVTGSGLGIGGDGEWEWYQGLCKVITNPNGGFQLLGIDIPNGQALTAYGPVLTLVPANSLTDNESYELMNNMASYPSGTSAGDVAMMPGQRFAMATPGNLFTHFHQGTTTANRTITWPDFTGTVGMFTGTPVNTDCVNWIVSGGVASLGDAGAACGSGGGGGGTTDPALQFSMAYYNTAGTVSHIGGVNGPTGPISVPSFWVTIPNSTGGGQATAPQPILAGIPGRTVSGASDTVLVTDRVSTVTYTNAGATAVSLPGAGTTGFGSNFCFKMKVQGSGAVATVTPAAGTINGGATQTVLQGQQALVCSFDNSNYIATIADPPAAAGSNIALTRGDSSLSFASSAGGGTVTHTGGLTSGQLLKGNGTADITVGDLSGDCSTSGSTVTTCTALNGTAFSGTNGNVVGFGASNIPVDTGIVAANVITSTGTLLSGNVVSGTAAKNVGPTSIATTTLVTAASNAGFANQLCASASTNKACAFTSLSDLSSTDYTGATTGAVNVLAGCPTNTATALTAGMMVAFLPNLANTTTTPTLNLCTLGAKTITKLGTAALATNDLITTAIAVARYDGTGWELQNPQTSSGGGSSALSSITAAAAGNTIANGNNIQAWNWQQTTNTQSTMKFGETSAAINGTVSGNFAQQGILSLSALSGSTATPLTVQQVGVTGSLAIPLIQAKTTWNGSSLYQGLVLAVVDTAHGAGSKIMNVYGGSGGTTSLMSLDTAGNLTTAGNLLSPNSPNYLGSSAISRWGQQVWSHANGGINNVGGFTGASGNICTTPGDLAATATDPSYKTCGTGATANTTQFLGFANGDTVIGSSSNPTNLQFSTVAKISSLLTTRAWMAIISNAGSTSYGTTDTPTTLNFAGIRFSSVAGDTNYTLVLCNAAACNATSTGVAADTSKHRFDIRLNDSTGTATGCVDGTCVTATTDYPNTAATGALGLGLSIDNTTTTVETLSWSGSTVITSN